MSGIVVVDKPAGLTSHDVVARLRRVLGTRKVGHAGTLDPMATGVLVVGVDRATRLLGHLALQDKEYLATIRLGAATVTDDAQGQVTTVAAPGDLAGLDPQAIRASLAAQVGQRAQRPSAVSAVKVDGQRAYARVRAGEKVELPAREVTIAAISVERIEPTATGIDIDIHVTCSSGTYIRAIARDVGEHLGVGGHLTALRRTRVGPFGLQEAVAPDDAERGLQSLDVVVPRCFPTITLGPEAAARARHGGAQDWPGAADATGPHGLLAPDGTVLGLGERAGARLRYVVVLVAD